jgi:ankyrin repeat protein
MALFSKRKPAASEVRVSVPTAVSGLTDLHDIAARGTAAAVKESVELGADVNEPNRVGYTPLSIAASRGDVDVARALLDAGADVDSADKTGTTALAAAVLNSKGRGEMITLLLERGADPTKPNNRGQTPLELARRMTATDVARYFEQR